MLNNQEIPIIDSAYGEDVVLQIEVLADEAEQIKKKLVEATAARIQIEQEDAVYSVR